MRNLGRLKQHNVRSVDAKKAPAELSLENLRQVASAGGTLAYAHSHGILTGCQLFP